MQTATPPSAAQNVEGLNQEMTNLLAQRSQIDDRIKAISAVMQGIGIGQRLQDELTAERAEAEKVAKAEAKAAAKAAKSA